MALYHSTVPVQSFQLICEQTDIAVSHLMTIVIVDIFQIIQIPHQHGTTADPSALQKL